MEIDFITSHHKKTKRNYLERMNNSKVKCMIEAKKYEKNYWDGPRKFGYGGYKYIAGRWTNVAKKLIKRFNLKNTSKILDVGCGKAFILYEIKKILPSIDIVGFDISNYGIRNAPREINRKAHWPLLAHALLHRRPPQAPKPRRRCKEAAALAGESLLTPTLARVSSQLTIHAPRLI